MSPIITTTEIARPATQVFTYATDPTRFHEWQEGVVDGHLDKPGPPQAGAKCLTTRRIGRANRAVTSELTHVDPPRTWGVRGIDGPIRATVDLTVDALTETALPPDDRRSTFEGHWHRQDSCPASRSPPGTKRDAKKPRDIEATDRNGAGAILRLTGLTFVGIEYPRKKRAPQRGGLSILCAGLCSIQLPLSRCGTSSPRSQPHPVHRNCS
jgi:hypothetical protein